VLTGQLDFGTDSGRNHFDAITNINEPRFFGESEPFSDIQLFVAPVGTSTFTKVGQTQTDSSGHWMLTTSTIQDGTYTVLVKATDESGFTTAQTQILPNGVQGPLVIDTAGPKVTNVQFNRLTGEILVTFQDSLSGVDLYSVVDASNYTILKRNTPIGTYLVTGLPTTGGGPGAQVTVDIQINRKKYLPGGHYVLIIHSKDPLVDVAGNALDGEFYNTFPSGNNLVGGDFVARLDSIHSIVSPPRTIVGPASPVNPPGAPGKGQRLPVTVPPKGVVTKLPSGPLGAGFPLQIARTRHRRHHH
jgi:hypothetical protein